MHPKRVQARTAFLFLPIHYIILGNNRPENLLDFVQILQEELVPMQAGDVPVTYADTSALERDFGFKPSTPLRIDERQG